jgi:hypothetical protein
MKKYLIIFAAFLSLFFENYVAAATAPLAVHPVAREPEPFFGFLLTPETDREISQLFDQNVVPMLLGNLGPSAHPRARLLEQRTLTLHSHNEILDFAIDHGQSHAAPFEQKRHFSLSFSKLIQEWRHGNGFTPARNRQLREDLKHTINLLKRLSKTNKITVNGVEKLSRFIALTLTIDRSGLSPHEEDLLNLFVKNPHISIIRATSDREEPFTLRAAKDVSRDKRESSLSRLNKAIDQYIANSLSPDPTINRLSKLLFGRALGDEAVLLHDEIRTQLNSGLRSVRKTGTLLNSTEIQKTPHPDPTLSPTRKAVLKELQKFTKEVLSDNGAAAKSNLSEYLGTLFAVDYPANPSEFYTHMKSIIPDGGQWFEVIKEIKKQLEKRTLYVHFSENPIESDLGQFFGNP